MKQYIGISRDHSGSMQSLAKKAMEDYNQNTAEIKKAAIKEGIDTIVSVVECGVGPTGKVVRAAVNSSITMLKPLYDYPTTGGWTPLFDSVRELIDLMRSVPDAADPEVSFLVMAITDGEENHSRTTGYELQSLMKSLQRNDNWTFTFRVPVGHGDALRRLGIPAGNIQEWEQTEKGFEAATEVTRRAVSNYFSGRTRGVRSTSAFYADLSNVTKKEVKATMTNISSEVRIWPVKEDGRIDEFVERQTKSPYVLGTAFYELTKPERAVQDYKIIVIRDKTKGEVYAGQTARDLLGLPTTGDVRLKPGDHGKFDIFIQSTSVNRKLIAGTRLLYWEHAGKLVAA